MTSRPTGAALALAMTLSLPASAATDQSLKDAWAEVEFLNFDRAISAFSEHAESGDPSSKQARIGLALALQYRQPDREGDKRRAAEMYDAMIATMDQVPTDPADRLILYLRARMHAGVSFPGDEPDAAEASKLFERLAAPGTADIFTELAAAHLALIELSAEDDARREAGIQQLRARLAQQPEHVLAGAQWMMLGNALRFPTDDPIGAVAAYERALEVGLPAENLIPSVHWRIARLAETLGDRERATAHYKLLSTEYKRSLFSHESSLAVERLAPVDSTDQPDGTAR